MQKLIDPRDKSTKYTLVISWGGVRGVYAVGALKAFEEFWLKDQITHIYGVSIGAIIAAFRASDHTAEEIFEIWMNFKIFSRETLWALPTKSLLSNEPLKKIFVKHFPKTIEELSKKVYIWAVDAKRAKYHLFKKWDLLQPMLWTMAIPWVFPPVTYKDFSLMDGWLINNFPVDIARNAHPNNKLIWIFLNKIWDQEKTTKTLIDSLMVAYDIIMRWPSMEKISIADYTIARHIPLKTLDTNKEIMKKTFEEGYKDALKIFWKH